jgi:hypothetical protein
MAPPLLALKPSGAVLVLASSARQRAVALLPFEQALTSARRLGALQRSVPATRAQMTRAKQKVPLSWSSQAALPLPWRWARPRAFPPAPPLPEPVQRAALLYPAPAAFASPR